MGAAGRLLQLNVPRQSKHTQDPNSVPVEIELVPGKSMPGSLGMRVVIVVPALAKSQHGNPETVGGSIAGEEALRAPHVSGRIH